MSMARLRRMVAWIALHLGVVRAFRKFVNAFEITRDPNGRPIIPLLQRRSSPSVLILVYHRINNERDPFFPRTPIAVFTKQMEFIAENYTVCSLDEIVQE